MMKRRMAAVLHFPAWAGLALLIGLAFVTRLTVNAWVLGFDYFPDPDHFIYETMAMNFLNGQGLSAAEGKTYMAPLYAIFLAGVYSLFGMQNAVALKIIESLIGALTCACIYLIGKRLYGATTGRIAGLIAVFYPFLVYATAPGMTENLFTFWLAAGMACLAKLLRAFSWRTALTAGLLLGLATLTRPLTLILPVALLVWAGLSFRKVHHAWRAVVVVSLVMAAVILPWPVRNYLIQGEWLFASEDGLTFWGSNNPVVAADPEKAGRWLHFSELPYASEIEALPEMERRRRMNALGWQFIRENPDKLLYLETQKLLRFWSLYPNRSGMEKVLSLLSYGLLFPFMLFGAVWGLLKKRAETLLLLGYISPFVVGTLIYYGSTRMRLPIEPYLILLAGYSLALLIERVLLVLPISRKLASRKPAGIFQTEGR